MRKKLITECVGITAILLVLSTSTLCLSVLAWTGSDEGYGQNTDNSTWQVSAKITGYYDTVGQYEQVYFQSWRGCISPVSYAPGEAWKLRWMMTGPYGTADTGYFYVGDETGPISASQTEYPSSYSMDYVTNGLSYSGAWFIIGGYKLFKPCEGSI